MHEQLQDMGQNITLEIPMNQFLWNPKITNLFLQMSEVFNMCWFNILFYWFYVKIPNETIIFN